MRHQYTPVFREFTTSSMWAESSDTRCVWLWLMLHADPEGFVPGTLPGLAVAANVSLPATREAVEKFMAPDPDSNTRENEGRRLEKVPHGWRILNFEYWRRLAQLEAEKARKRRWAQANRKKPEQLSLPYPPEFLRDVRDTDPTWIDPAAFTDVDALSTGVDDSSENIDAPKPKPKSSPEVVVTTAREGFDNQELPVIPVVRAHHDLEGLDETGLEDEAVLAGMSREWFRERLKSARNLASIGGQSGVRDQRAWVRLQFGNWKTWEETNRAKDAQRSAATGPSRRFAGADVRVEPFDPDARQQAFARKLGLPLGDLLKGVLDDHPQPLPAPLSRRALLSERLTAAAKQKQHGHPVTGKLTLGEVATWGPVPPGGAIPGEAA